MDEKEDKWIWMVGVINVHQCSPRVICKLARCFIRALLVVPVIWVEPLSGAAPLRTIWVSSSSWMVSSVSVSLQHGVEKVHYPLVPSRHHLQTVYFYWPHFLSRMVPTRISLTKNPLSCISGGHLRFLSLSRTLSLDTFWYNRMWI